VKKSLVMSVWEKVGDAELSAPARRTGSNVVRNTLDGIAGTEGRKYAEKVQEGSTRI